MLGSEGSNYIPPLALTLGHHTPAIIYSGKVIRELGCRGTGGYNEDGDGKDSLCICLLLIGLQ